MDEDVDLMFEIGTLRHVGRNWRQFGGLDFANVAEHSFRVAWLAMLIAEREGGDPAHAALLAIVHDLAETRVGDRNYIQREHVTQRADDAVTGAVAGTSLAHLVGAAWDELRECTSVEARSAHDADVLDCDLELQERRSTGATLPQILDETRRRAAAGLMTSTGRDAWTSIKDRSPHEWHLNAQNRLNSGDWSKETPS